MKMDSNNLPRLRLNDAEVVFAPFHDPEFDSELNLAISAAPSTSGLSRRRCWDRIHIHWKRASTEGEVFTLHLPGQIRLEGFDHFIFCITYVGEIEARFSAITAAGAQPLTDWVPSSGQRIEITPLIPAVLGDRIRGIEVSFRSASPLDGFVDLIWFGLGNAAKREVVTTPYTPPYGADWQGLLALPEAWPDTTPFQCDLLFASEDLPDLRDKLARPEWAPLLESMHARAQADLATAPEHWLGAHVAWTDTRYIRVRERGAIATFNEALVIGFVAIIQRDLTLARQALRHLLTLLHCGDWSLSDENRLQGSTWDQRCFHEEMITTAVSLLTDWFGWALTPRAHDLIRQTIWDKGLAVIERDMMKIEEVHHINQGPWFCRARILGGLLLEQSWPRVGDYVERAKETLLEGLDRYILSDGGTDEGLGYFGGTLETSLGGLIAYARSRNVPLRDLLPPQLARSTDFLEALSAVKPGHVLLDGDNSNDESITDAMLMLAGVYPEQAYLRIAAAALPIPTDLNTYYRQYYGCGVYAAILGPTELPQAECIVPTFARLPVSGHLTSLRRVGDHSVRLHFAGAKANASHSHLDKGNFTLEIDGQPVLVDRGILRYDDPRAGQLKLSARHNVLTPVTDSGGYLDQAQVTAATIPGGQGDERSLNAHIDLANVWRERMSRSERQIVSTDPGTFTVADSGELLQPARLAFHLQALTPFTIDGTSVSLRVGAQTLRIHAPWAVSASQSVDLINCHGQAIHHLVLTSEPRSSFELETHFECTFA
jgi:hypothetical protein